MTMVTFKSIPKMWKKEQSGIKPNTFRKIDENDKRFISLRNGCEEIRIINTKTLEYFIRTITDYTEYDGYGIISWKHKGVRL